MVLFAMHRRLDYAEGHGIAADGSADVLDGADEAAPTHCDAPVMPAIF
ncbi:hypothetical protein [Streptomyces sp. NPDC057428]